MIVEPLRIVASSIVMSLAGSSSTVEPSNSVMTAIASVLVRTVLPTCRTAPSVADAKPDAPKRVSTSPEITVRTAAARSCGCVLCAATFAATGALPTSSMVATHNARQDTRPVARVAYPTTD